MVKEILDHNGTWTVIGLLLGFLLSEGSAFIREKVKVNRCVKSLRDEVRFNHHQTINKIDILGQVIEALKTQQFLSTQCASYSTIDFDINYAIATGALSKLEKDNLRHFNGFYKKIDQILSEFDAVFKSDIDNYETRKNTLDSVYQASVIQLENVSFSLEQSLKLSESFINGSPKEIFVASKS